GHLRLRRCAARPRSDVTARYGHRLDSAGDPLPWCPAGGPGRVLTGMGGLPARLRGSAVLLPGALATGPGPRRAVRPHAGHGERRGVDGGETRGPPPAG